MSEITDVLERAGLSNAEAKIYAALSRYGPVKAGAIITATGMHKATVYLTLASLQKKGLVSFIIQGKAAVWQASNPAMLVQQMKECEELIQKILPKLMPAKKEKITATIFEGKEGIKMVLREVLQSEEYCHILPGVQMAQILGNFFHQFQNLKKKRHIRSYALLSENFRAKKTVKQATGEFRYLHPSYESPVSTIIYGNKIAIILWTAKIVLVIESSDAAIAYNKYFNVLWKMAKR